MGKFMTEEILLQHLKCIDEAITEECYPQSYHVLDKVRENGFTDAGQKAIDYANAFFSADEEVPMPKAIGDFVKEIYEEAIDQGSGEAACNLGSLYYSGRIGEQNFRRAVELYTLAAARGERQAAENLGYCYYYGRDVAVDYEKAFHYFALGAFDGHLVSLYKIGDMYRYGYYVEKNEKEAFYIYTYCIEMMTEEASAICGADIYMRIADCYADGIGTEKNEEQALLFYQLASNAFRTRIMNGDFMVKKNYYRCIREERKLQEVLEGSFPSWEGF